MGDGSAASAVLSGLASVQRHLEFPLSRDDPDVIGAAALKPGGSKGQAAPAQLSFFYTVGKLATGQDGIAGIISWGLMVIMRGGVRHRHACSSSDAGAWFRCSAGKTRKNGREAEYASVRPCGPTFSAGRTARCGRRASTNFTLRDVAPCLKEAGADA